MQFQIDALARADSDIEGVGGERRESGCLRVHAVIADLHGEEFIVARRVGFAAGRDAGVDVPKRDFGSANHGARRIAHGPEHRGGFELGHAAARECKQGE